LEHTTSAAVLPDREPAQSSATVEQPQVPSITDADIIAYLRRVARIAEIANLASQDALVLATCDRLGISISEAELQTAGDAFRTEYKLLGATETLAWLTQQQITVEDWSEGIRVSLLTKKLKEHLFGGAIDGTYIENRDHYRRVALSQILVLDLPTALSIVQALRQENASFSALALEYSKGRQSQDNGGFVGVRFLAELLPEIAQAVAEAETGETIGPVQTRLGYHILRVEKQFPTELSESAREQILDSLFQSWLRKVEGSDLQA
ncbi:MAG: peptidylprolyl isomerase, partial [Kovacikia sp.]